MAGGKIRAGKKASVAAHFINHHGAAFIAWNVADLVLNLNFFNFLFGNLKRFFKAGIKVPQNLLWK